MPLLPIPSLHTWIDRVTRAKNRSRSAFAPKHDHSPRRAKRQQHALHHLLKSLGHLPDPWLNKITAALDPNATCYAHTDAHLRAILALSNHRKRPLTQAQLPKLRRKFTADVVSMQAPSVWQSPKTHKMRNDAHVRWHDQSVANASGGLMTIRCYQPPQRNDDHPPEHQGTVLLYLHGGGFCMGDIDSHHEFCQRICQQTRWPVVSVDYRLAPEHPAPIGLADCLAAYVWLSQNAHQLGASAAHIVLAGDSAGGNLAIITAQQVSRPNPKLWQSIASAQHSFDPQFIDSWQDITPPFALWPLYPVTDSASHYPSWDLYGQGLLLDHNDVEVFDRAYLQDQMPRNHALISPMYGDNQQMCPTYLVTAELDILRDEGLAYAEQLQKGGIEVVIQTVLGAPHGFIHLMSVHQEMGEQTRALIDTFARFVQQLPCKHDDA